MLKLYLLSQIERCGYDTFDCCIVAANSVEEACNITPQWFDDWNSSTWASSPDNVDCEEIGLLTAKNYGKGVVISSFNAG